MVSKRHIICGETRALCCKDIIKPGKLVWKTSLLLILIFGALLLTSCKTNLVKMRYTNATNVLSKMRARPAAAVKGGCSVFNVHDCVALALKNSLDVQTAFWEEQVRGAEVLSQKMRMLPKVEGRYELTLRDRHSWSRSDVIGAEGLYETLGPAPGTGVTRFSTGRERYGRKWQAEIRWSPMDAAMARYVSKIKCNEATHARYQRVRVAQKLVSNVKGVFYRLLALNMALPKAKQLVNDRQSIVRDLGALASKGLIDTEERVYAKDMLAQARRILADVKVGIEKQRELLATSLNICPTSCLQLEGALFPLPKACLDACKLEKLALVNRPEAYQADLAHLSSVDEYKRLIVKCFPKVEGYLGYYRDENKFLLHNDWSEGGMRITWDLMEFAADLFQKESASNKIIKTERETALVSMGLLSQVKLSVLDAISAIEEYKKFERLLSGEREKLRVARDVEDVKEREAQRKIIRIDRQAIRADMLEDDINRIMSAAEVHAALAELDATVGSNYPISAADPPPDRAVVPTLAVAADRVVRGVVETTAAMIPIPW